MDINEVPQDPLHFKDRDKLRKLMYATDKEGKYTGVTSAGWEAENQATQQAWDEVLEDLKETLELVHAGKLSPLAYYMKKNLMDISLLAKYAGRWRWTIKQHMKPEKFSKLHPAIWNEYATIFKIDVTTLLHPPQTIDPDITDTATGK